MIVKSFIADTVAGALKMARSELGGDAVILKTRKINGNQRSVVGGKIEVTACIDKATEATPPRVAVPLASEAPEQVPEIINHNGFCSDEIAKKLDFLIDIFQAPSLKTSFKGTIGRLYAALIHADVCEELAGEIAERLNTRFGSESPYATLVDTTVEMLIGQLPKTETNLEFKTGQKIVMVGPAGGGKTSLLGRMASHLVMENRMPVCLTSMDKVKVSAPEEIQTYADILDIDTYDLPREIDETILDRDWQDKITLIDTPALNSRDRSEIKHHAEKLGRIKPDRIIGVFPATVRTSDLFDMIRAYRPLGLTELALTMTDQTCRLGGVVSLAIQTGLPLSILGTGRRAGCIELHPDYASIIREFMGGDKGGDDE